MRKSIVTVGLVGLSASLLLAGCSSSAESEVTPTVTPAPSETTVVSCCFGSGCLRRLLCTRFGAFADQW